MVLPAQANDPPDNVVFGGFEIDGNFYEGFDNNTTDTGPDGDPVDWGSAEIQADVEHFDDAVGGPDPTVFDSGAKEDDLDTWEDSGSASAPGVADIDDVWVYDRLSGGDQYAYIGWSRATATGSVQWYVELNQLENVTNVNGVSVPNRSDGDIRVSLSNTGTGAISVDAVEVWDSGAWVPLDYAGLVEGTTNDSEINIPGGGLAAGLFNEFGFNITALLGGGDCTFEGFNTLNLRSQTGAGDQAQLKDYATFDISIPPQCGDLTIEKRNEAGVLIGGATFTITPNPIPSASDPTELVITDNDANDEDPTDGVIFIDPVEPGTYTITETTPPPGYIGDPDPQEVTIDDFESETVTFENTLGSITWSKYDEDGETLICCATFTVVGTDGAAAGDPWNIDITVTDNGANDADPDEGEITVVGLPTGTYTVTETVPPTGYALPADPSVEGVVISADTPDVTITDGFVDPRLLTDLTVEKLDATTELPLAGADFELYRDTDGDGEEGVTDEAPDADDELVGSCTTTLPDGTCTVTGLSFGTYYWFEVSAPTGYDLPADRTSAMITINAENAGTELTVTTFLDQQAQSELTVEKLDATTEEPLAGAEFDLVLDDGDGVYEEAEDTVVDSCTTALPDGTCTVTGLGFGTYFWVETAAPPGYDLPADPVSDPIVIDAENAGTELTVTTFLDPQILSELTVEKLDATTEEPLAGAEFDLVLDDGDGVYEEAEDTVVDSCTTALPDGTCTVTGLGFGTYFWVETAAPPGYDLPADPVSDPIVIDAENAGTELTVTTFLDPQMLTDLSVRKIDEDNEDLLDGAVFELYLDDGDGVGDAPDEGDVLVDTCTTGDDGPGVCTVTGLAFGDYYWYEVSAPTGYDLPADRTSAIITINAANAGGELTPYTFTNPRMPGELMVEKLDATDGTPLAGATFELYLDDGDGTFDEAVDTFVGECTTNGTGTCSIEDLDFGTYFWVEVEAPMGYDLPEDVVSDPVTIDASNVEGEVQVTSFDDPRKLSELTVEKLDEVDHEPLAGAEFDLVLDDGDGVYEEAEDTVVDSCTTDDTGTCTIGDLGFGTYFWVETAAPQGYGLPDDVVSDPIVIDATNAGTEIVAVTFHDPRVPSELKVMKVDATTLLSLSGAEFDLVLDDGDGVYEEGVDVVVDSCTTGEDGTCTIGDLDFGTYFWVETMAPAGYTLPDNPVSDPIVIDATNAGTELEVVTFFDPQIRSELSVVKIDADTQEELSGATFELYRDTDGDGEAGVTDDAPDPDDMLEGSCANVSNCTVGGLTFGTYYWFEAAAPTGYELPADRTSAMITIDATNAGSEFATVTFEDAQIRSELSVTKLDADTGEPLDGAVFQLYLDNEPGEAPDNDTPVGEPCTTGEDGPGVCSVGDLLFGTYYWFEVSAPVGYELPEDRTSASWTFTPENAGDPVNVDQFVFEDAQVRSELSVMKLDADTGEPLPGATFQLYLDDEPGEAPDNDTPIGEPCVTPEDGVCTVGDLTFGTYYWFEVSAPVGYELPEDRTSGSWTFTPENAGDPVNVDQFVFEDAQIRTDLSVMKVDAKSGEPLDGAVFELYLDDGDGVGDEPDEGDVVVDTCTTGDDGPGVCTITGLTFGDYYWYEVSSPEGYDLPEDRTSSIITINAENAGGDLEAYVFTNPRLPGALTVEKLDETDGAALAGATFELYLDDGDGMFDEAVDELKGECTTNDTGTCTIEDLDFGTYFWVEVEAPMGYDLPDVVVSEPVTIDASNVEDEIQVSTFHDPRKLSELTVMKVDETDESPLAGAEFDLVLDDGDGVYDGALDAVVDSCTTGEDGTCTIGDLGFGTYFWVETAAPQGYGLPDDVVSDPMVIDATNAGGEFTVVTFHDPRLLTEIAVKKIAEDTKKVLAGAVFELYLDDGDGVGKKPDKGDELVGECTTGEDGLCSFTDLGFGDYYWYEVKAPKGYKLPDDRTSTILTVNAENAGQTLTFTFEDPPKPPVTPKPPEKPKPPEREFPVTGAGMVGLLAAIAAGLALIGGGLLAVRRRFGTTE